MAQSEHGLDNVPNTLRGMKSLIMKYSSYLGTWFAKGTMQMN